MTSEKNQEAIGCPPLFSKKCVGHIKAAKHETRILVLGCGFIFFSMGTSVIVLGTDLRPYNHSHIQEVRMRGL